MSNQANSFEKNLASKYKNQKKILKRGLIDEREKRGKLENEIQCIQIKMKNLIEELDSKKSEYEKLLTENTFLKNCVADLKIEQKDNNEEHTNLISGFSSKFKNFISNKNDPSIQKEIALIETENQFLKEELNNLSERLEETQKNMENLKKDYQASRDILQEENEILNNKYSIILKELEEEKEKHKTFENNYKIFLDDKIIYEQTLNQILMNLNDYESNWVRNLDNNLHLKEYALHEINNAKTYQEENKVLAEKLMEMKQRLEEVISYYRVYLVKKVALLSNKQFVITFTRDDDLNFVLEISNEKMKNIYLIENTEIFDRDKNTNNFEIIIFPNKKKYKFQTIEKSAIFEIFSIIKSRAMIENQDS